MESGICVCGAGTMGRGIALAIAGSNLPVILYDVDAETISAAESQIKEELHQSVKSGRIPVTKAEQILLCISFTNTLSDCKAGLIIEAIVEKAEEKSNLFIELARFNTTQTIFASNTSSLSVTQIAEQTPFPERVAGLHFFNPANRMKLVEIIRTKYTHSDLINQLTSFAIQLGKTPVVCGDLPGFIVNHVARPYTLEAMRLVEQHVSGITTIDRLMESAGFKMGPFHLMDLIGNDINYTVSASVYEALGKPERLKPSNIQKQKLDAGKLGRKTGEGFFIYTKPASQ